MDEQQERVVDRSLSDMEKLQLFFCALRAKAMADDAIEKPHDVPPHFRAFASELETRWQEVRGTALDAPPRVASEVLREFVAPLEEGLRQGESDMQQSFLAGEDIEERFVFWWLLHLYKERAVAIEAELGLVPEKDEPTVMPIDEPDAVDEEALSSFQAAMELAV
ncbi:MAG: hypothetical protein M0T85_02325 [Dehalococcoidales bacterium]|nr:hypothetical protein [Dehalococcoidales bacterium]